MTTHRCARPDNADTAEPWRCSECGMLWESLSATPITLQPAAEPERKRTIYKPAIFAFTGLIAWVGLVETAAARALMVPGISLLSVVGVAVVVAFWQRARSKDRYYRCPDCGRQDILPVCMYCASPPFTAPDTD
ncbi:hypothetical protein GCM10010176_001620 [Nonomuraea spiralis]|nr:hypothetical protein GCM10010176_001620 [Nonomuraea spiralis]